MDIRLISQFWSRLLRFGTQVDVGTTQESPPFILSAMKYLLTVLLSVFFFSLTYASAPTEFTQVDLGFIACLVSIVLTAQLAIAHMFVRCRVVQNMILAEFATVNIFSLNLLLNMTFLYLPGYGQVLSLLLSMFIIFTFMNMLDEIPRISRVLPALFALATAGVLAQTLLSVAPVPEVSAEHGKTSAKNIRIVDFKTKPNVYFIAFDSLIPKVLLQKHLGLETTPYHEVLDAHFQRFKNFFADRVPTRRSLNSLLALDIGHYSEARRNNIASRFFSGRIPSPLFEIFKHNGYETNTLYRSGYFGWNKGPHVDNYWIDRLGSKTGACEFISTSGLKAFTFMGYCSLVKSNMFISAFRGQIIDSNISDIDFLINKMRAGLQRDAPQIFVGYVYSPGHTVGDFDRKDTEVADKYRQYYFKRSKKTAAYLNNIVTFIANEDPEAIVYVFGDHGPGISRKDTFKENGVIFVQDRFGVYGGIHPRDRCAESFSTPYNKNFMTVLQGAHMIIKCLSGGKYAFITLEDYRLPESRILEDYRLPESKTTSHNRYEDYLYE